MWAGVWWSCCLESKNKTLCYRVQIWRWGLPNSWYLRTTRKLMKRYNSCWSSPPPIQQHRPQRRTPSRWEVLPHLELQRICDRTNHDFAKFLYIMNTKYGPGNPPIFSIQTRCNFTKGFKVHEHSIGHIAPKNWMTHDCSLGTDFFPIVFTLTICDNPIVLALVETNRTNWYCSRLVLMPGIPQSITVS